MPVPPACRYTQHEVLTRTEGILASTSDSDPTFNWHWVGVGLWSPPAVSNTRPAAIPSTTSAQRLRRWSNIVQIDVGPTLYKCYTNVLCLLGWSQPSKHEALNQCWFDAGPVSQTVSQHWISIGSTSCLLGVLTSVLHQFRLKGRSHLLRLFPSGTTFLLTTRPQKLSLL